MTEFEQGFQSGLWEAVIEVQGWRELTIKAHNECSCINPDEHVRETTNKLNLLGVIESKLRLKAGESSKKTFKEMTDRKKTEILLRI